LTRSPPTGGPIADRRAAIRGLLFFGLLFLGIVVGFIFDRIVVGEVVVRFRVTA
jgi:hypothetical protein